MVSNRRNARQYAPGDLMFFAPSRGYEYHTQSLCLTHKTYLTMSETIDMVTISSKGQIVIPKKIMKILGLKEQDKLLVFSKGENQRSAT